MADRLPWHPRALELFRQGYDVQIAGALAADEHRLLEETSPEYSVGAERQSRPPSSPPGRMVGADRGRP